mmetsp:Transcript_14344/g.21189  ORF Transcript_14344/g.21189 Transcript_14344/m.21189 type:complete len:655 (+) Transcript_14344:125-2089(+)
MYHPLMSLTNEHTITTNERMISQNYFFRRKHKERWKNARGRRKVTAIVDSNDERRRTRIRHLPPDQAISFMILCYAMLIIIFLVSVVVDASATTPGKLSSSSAVADNSLSPGDENDGYLPNINELSTSPATQFKSASKMMKWMEDFGEAHNCHSSGFMPPPLKEKRKTIVQSIIRGGSTRVKEKNQLATSSSKKKKSKRRSNNTGFYYGLQEDVCFPSSSASKRKSTKTLNKPKRNLFPGAPPPPMPITSSGTLADVMGEALVELREMREEIAALRDEMKYMKSRVKYERKRLSNTEEDDYEDEDDMVEHYTNEEDEKMLAHTPEQGVGSTVTRLKRRREFDRIGAEVEEWAHRLLFEEGGEEDGWKEIQCNKFVRKKFNSNGSTKCFMKWLPDQRGRHANPEYGDRKYPCIKCYATIDAPFEEVCSFLSNSDTMPTYNELVIDHRDIEEITPHSKICWSQCPQILFIKSRDFVTFCHLKWKRDGTQVVVNQACDHEDMPGVHEEKEGNTCRAFALRGANFIQRDPKNPDKTRFAILAHADPGGGLPEWTVKTAVNAVAPIEPFKLFHNINSQIIAAGPSPPRAEMVSSLSGRSARPGGLSQLGYACFWPNGGGLKEGFLHHEQQQHHQHDDSNLDQLDENLEHLDDDESSDKQ